MFLVAESIIGGAIVQDVILYYVYILYTYNMYYVSTYSVYIIFYLIYYYVHIVARQITLAIIQRVTRHANSRRLLCKVDCHRVRRV